VSLRQGTVAATPEAPAMVCVATVATAHGVRGAVKLRCYTEEPEGVAAYGPLYDAKGRELFTLTLLHRVRGGIVARIEGVDSREAAEALRGLDLYVPRDRLPPPEPEEFYHEDLVGLEAVDREGRPQGRVVGVQNYGAGDLLELRTADGGSVFVPFTHESVPEVDLGAGRVVVVLPGVV
jgi:16S rRNA processing protein RimM